MEFKHLIAVTYCLIGVNIVRGDTFGATIEHYYGATVTDLTSTDLATAESVVTSFDPEKDLALFIHGWRQSPLKPTIQTLIKSYISNGDYNILILNWSDAAGSSNYVAVSSKVDELGREVALFLGRLNTLGVSYSSMHLIGHSLGAYVASSAGKYTVQSSNIIGRITGLDPANFFSYPLESANAAFVDVIHTDRGVMGTVVDSGQVAFYPNGGDRLQPRCQFVFLPIGITLGLLQLFGTLEAFACSHLRAIDLWSESVKNNILTNFLSTTAGSTIKIQMGNNCPTTAVGHYYLTTNGQSLFSK